MLNMKTTTGNGGSHNELLKRAFFQNKTLLNSNSNSIKYDLPLAKFREVFSKMGYFVPVSLSTCHWQSLTPKTNPDLFPPLKVFISDGFDSFYFFNVASGTLRFYPLKITASGSLVSSIHESICLGGEPC